MGSSIGVTLNLSGCVTASGVTTRVNVPAVETVLVLRGFASIPGTFLRKSYIQYLHVIRTNLGTCYLRNSILRKNNGCSALQQLSAVLMASGIIGSGNTGHKRRAACWGCSASWC
jgi:hypothetical protein